MAIALALASVCAFAPLHFTGWLSLPADLVLRLIAPVSHPARLFASWIDPRAPHAVEPAEIARLRDELDGYRTLYFRERARTNDLRALIRDLQSGRDLAPDRDIRVRTAAVIGESQSAGGAVLRLRAPGEDESIVGAVATVAGTQILGRVVSASAGLALVRPITDRAAPALLARIALGEGAEGPLCTLRPTGDGALSGPVEDLASLPADLQRLGLHPGQEVRLADDAWPAGTRMLLIGLIERVEPSPDSPLRQVVFVRPKVDLIRVSEVVLRISIDPERGP